MDIGISDVPRTTTEEPSFFGVLFDCVYLVDFLVWWLFMPIFALFSLLASVLPLS
ncbi:MAG: hypothetical protein J0I12_21240 [Candidatus Eremiobacteraeota bacterium]|nr:hypothetical protein [Candidatus Eremiobacteraeota bacterium]